jgi:hypothetical protein
MVEEIKAIEHVSFPKDTVAVSWHGDSGHYRELGQGAGSMVGGGAVS